ncbi:FAD assembly factor SdhE [Frigidibacter sp. MR17.24]|uniref:FAD assembly factor SdhE n=1 Tax=Frigidibacter sp. MR17.24 TaxID=3127345 RepID=UPI003FA58690
MAPTETAEARLKRLRMRSWRRGTKEMDMILGPWADAHLAGLSESRLAVYEILLEENDQDLYRWVTSAEPAPAAIVGLLDEIGAFARGRFRPGA